MAVNTYNILDNPLNLSRNTAGQLVYTHSTPDASIELGNVNAGSSKGMNVVNIYDQMTFTAVGTYTNDSGATGVDAIGACTLNGLDSVTGAIYIGASRPFGQAVVTVNASNGDPTTMTVSYFDKTTGAWTAVSNMTDGTSDTGRSLFATGTVKWTIPSASNWQYGTLVDLAGVANTVVNSTSNYYWVRLTFSADLDAGTSTTTIKPNLGSVSSGGTVTYSPLVVGLEIVKAYIGSFAADTTGVEALDVTAKSGTDSSTTTSAYHTGTVQAIAAAVAFSPVGVGGKTNTAGTALGLWPTYSIGAYVTVTNLYGVNIINTSTGVSANAVITNYTAINIGAMTQAVNTRWSGIVIDSFTGTANAANAIALSAVGLHIKTFTGSVLANGVKTGIYIEAMSGTALINYGMFIDTPASGTKNVGLRVAGGASAAIWSNGAILSNSTGGIGYGTDAILGTGAGSTVTQTVSKSTDVTINAICGEITMEATTAINAGAEATFVVNNNTVDASDAVILCIKSGATAGAYLVSVGAIATDAFRVTVSNVSASNLTETIKLTFAVIKAVTS